MPKIWKTLGRPALRVIAFSAGASCVYAVHADCSDRNRWELDSHTLRCVDEFGAERFDCVRSNAEGFWPTVELNGALSHPSAPGPDTATIDGHHWSMHWEKVTP